jgi:hypothetical protein
MDISPIIFSLLYRYTTNNRLNTTLTLRSRLFVHEAKLNIRTNSPKEKDRGSELRSAEIGECRVKKMKIRDLLHTLVSEAGNSAGCRGKNY